MMWGGKFLSESVIGVSAPTVGTSGILLLPSATMAVGTGFDSTTSNVVDLFAKWSVSDAANSITLHNYLLESLN